MQYEAFIGLLLPVVVDFVNKYVSNSKWRFVVSVLVSVGVGVVLNYESLSLEDILGSAAVVFAAAQASYKLYWHDSALRGKLLA